MKGKYRYKQKRENKGKKGGGRIRKYSQVWFFLPVNICFSPVIFGDIECVHACRELEHGGRDGRGLQLRQELDHGHAQEQGPNTFVSLSHCRVLIPQ
jgi:hypothetical protein